MSHHAVLRRHPSPTFIEPLETRIAPALLVNGANLLGGLGNPTTGETSLNENAGTLVTVNTGQAVVWYDAATEHITGISAGPGVSLQITGNLYGDIVANLTAAGRLSDSDSNPANGEDGAVLLANNIVAIKTIPNGAENGDIGHILTAGSVTNVQISGQLQGIYAGDGVFRAESAIAANFGPTDREVVVTVGSNLDTNPLQPGVQPNFDLLKSFAKLPTSSLTPAGSISIVSIQTAKDLQLFAGNGFSDATHTALGGAGGGVSNVTIQSAISDNAAVPSYAIIAGSGGLGKTGGLGGSVVKVIEKASNGIVTVHAGDGGDGSGSFGGLGGAGGSVALLDVQSDSTSYTVTAGKGGAGYPAGAGGSLIGNNFAGKSPNTGIILSGDFVGNDGIDDILIVDTGSGQAVLMQNSGDGTNFTPVVQDPITQSVFIAPKGTGPSSAVVADVNGDGALDFVVAYPSSTSLGVFLNDGTGVFTGSSINIGVGAAKIVAGNFGGTSDLDIAALVTGPGSSSLVLAEGDGAGHFTPLDATTALNVGNATAIVAAPINANSLDDLFISFRSGKIESALATGSITSPFSVADTTAVISGVIGNMDVDAAAHRLLAVVPDTGMLSVFTFSATGALTVATGPDLTTLGVKPIVGHFLHGAAEGDIALLSTTASGSELDGFHFDNLTGTYTLISTAHSIVALKNFAVVNENTDTGFAALGGSLGRFQFSQSYADFTSISLPFAGKSVNATAGDGGMGLGAGKGGLGGGISGINIEATDISLITGHGGDSAGAGGGGAGGAILNGSTLTTASGVSIKPQLLAEQSLDVLTGYGGAPAGSGLTAVGGAGGNISGMIMTLATGDIHVTTGHGGDGHGGLAGAGGSVLNLNTTNLDGSVQVGTGFGGNQTAGILAGAAGGAVTGFTHKLQLSEDLELAEKSYAVTLTTGIGGNSAGGVGGAGGAISLVSLMLDPANNDTVNDSTVSVLFTTGKGGNGARGGAGGAITGVKSTTVFDEVVNGFYHNSYATMELATGAGGIGATGAGGAGGAIALGSVSVSGITAYDPDSATPNKPALLLTTGIGGSGATIGGAGGAISAVKSSNSSIGTNTALLSNMLSSAQLVAGDGGASAGAGGAGGGITGVSIGVRRMGLSTGGSLTILSGNGGTGGTIGGAGGGIASSTAASVNGDDSATVPTGILTAVNGSQITGYGVLLGTGHGGQGVTAGGAGGSITTISISSPQNENIFSSLVVAGKGGNATAASAIAGAGGNISLLNQGKDLNSSLNVVQAGDGGANGSGFGGHGGNITGIRTAGFIGKPTEGAGTLGVFDQNVAQGLFAGRGGVGSSGLNAGIAGAVSTVLARQISAIAATVDANGLFGLASLVTGVKADLIGFEVNRDNAYENVSGINNNSPSGTRPVDGFILAQAVSLINTLNPARTAAFTFTS